MIFHNVYTSTLAPGVLYRLLEERTPEQAISHQKMPTMREHLKFIDSHPYPYWYLILPFDSANECYGSIYLTSNREVGLCIFKEYQGMGHGRAALQELINRHGYPIFANVNPANKVSCELWESYGGKICQVTYKIEGSGNVV